MRIYKITLYAAKVLEPHVILLYECEGECCFTQNIIE